MLSIPVVAIAVALMIVALIRQPDRKRRAVLLKRTGFGLMALSAFFIGAFIIGETFADPGGWKAAGLVAAWAVPLLASRRCRGSAPAGRSASWPCCRRQ